MRALRRLLPLALVAMTVLLPLLAGCGLKGSVKPNLPPETSLFVQGPVDVVNHVVHLYWYGTDTDGYIVGYQIRLTNPADTVAPQWVNTARTDSLITVYTPNGYTAPRFEVRAIDNTNQIDPTPAVEDFQFSNKPPTVSLLQKPTSNDTSFATVSVTWSAGDIDGDANKMVFHVWLDGQAADPLVTTEHAITVPSERFLRGPYASRYRRLYLQAVDDGGRFGNIDSVTWFVRSPVPDSTKRARLLIVDDVLSTEPSNFATDNLFNSVTATKLPAGTFTVLRLRAALPWVTPKDVEQTFKQFETVIWYRGIVSSFPFTLRTFQDGVSAYLDGGGKMYIESLSLTSSLNVSGALSLEFVSRHLDTDYQFQNWGGVDSTIAWGVAQGGKFYSTALNDSLLSRSILANLRGFRPGLASEVLIEAPPGTLTPPTTETMAVALNVSQPNGGRLVASSYPLVASSTPNPNPPFPARAVGVLTKIYDLLGLN